MMWGCERKSCGKLEIIDNENDNDNGFRNWREEKRESDCVKCEQIGGRQNKEERTITKLLLFDY